MTYTNFFHAVNNVNHLRFIASLSTAGYGIHRVFNGERPYCVDKYDYNPEMDEMHSAMYHQEVNIADRSRIMDMGYNEGTINRPLCNQVSFAEASPISSMKCVSLIQKNVHIYFFQITKIKTKV